MNKEKKSKKEQTIAISVGIVVFAITFFGVQQMFTKDLAVEMRDAAAEVNKETPMQVDEFTRLDSASTKGKTNFIYHYTLFDLEKSEVNLDTVNKYIRPGIIENVKSTPELKDFRDNNITMDYRYYDRNGEFVTEITVTPDLYK